LQGLQKLGIVTLVSAFTSRSTFRLDGIALTEKGEALYEQHKN
jgi:hypothetical protein